MGFVEDKINIRNVKKREIVQRLIKFGLKKMSEITKIKSTKVD